VLYMANPCSARVRAAMTAGRLGMITTPAQGNRRPPGALWCADNGCGPGRHGIGAGYPGDEAFLTWLAHLAADPADPGALAACRFAVAPDVVADAAATLARSAPFLPAIRDLGYPVALVAQDGLEDLQVPWDDIDALFIGGSTEWKLGQHAHRLGAEAKRRGKWLHMGRVNSARRFAIAELLGCDSVDGTYLTYGPDTNLPDVLTWSNSLFALNE
jgi:hypothetical protein